MKGASVELVVPKRFKEVTEEAFKYYSVKTPFKIRKIWSFDFLLFGFVLGRLAFILQYANFYLFVLGLFLFGSRERIIYTMDNFGCLLTFLGYRVIFETHVGIGSYQKHFLPLLRRAKGIVSVNSIIKSDFIKSGFSPENILVAPNGVDLDVFSGTESKEELRENLKLPPTAKIVSYVGKYKTMGMDKGVDALVQVFMSIRLKRTDTFLLIVGLSDDEKKELEGTLGRANIPDESFRLVGHVSQSEVARFMRASDVLVMNYPNTEYYAKFMSPMKMFEYMASHVPMVTTDLPAVREILDEETAVMVLPDDKSSLEVGILKVLNDEVLGKELADKAYEKVLGYTWEKRAQRIIDFINL